MLKLSRRRALAAVTALAPFAPAPVGATPRDTLVIGKAIDDTITLDPGECYELTGTEVCTNLYDRLLRYEADDLARLTGGVAESWEIAADHRTYTFRIRPGQRFGSGNPLTAEDCAWSLQRVVLMNKTSSFLLTQLGWTPANVRDMARAPAADRLVLHVPASLAPSLVLNVMTSIVASVIDRKAALANERDGDLGNAWLKSASASSGAYRLASWRPNDSIVLEANRAFRLGPPKLRRVVLRHLPDPATQRALLEKGDIDVARGLTPEHLSPVAFNRDLRIESFPGVSSLYAIMNLRHGPFADIRVRRAVKMLVDYETMAASFLKGRFFVHQTFLPLGFLGAIVHNPFQLDVDSARRLLHEAGYPNGFALRLSASTNAPFAQIARSLQATLALGGIRATVAAADARQVIGEIRSRSFEMALLAWAPDYFDPHSNADFFVQGEDIGDQPRARTAAWRASWLIPDLTAAMRRAAQEPDSALRSRMYMDLQTRVTDEGPYVWMFQNNWLVAMRANLRGYPRGLFEDQFFYRTIAKA